MKVTVCFDNIRVVVPCRDGSLLVRDLMHEAIIRYRKATGKTEPGPVISSLSSLTGGGLLDPDDRLCDVADDREQIIAHCSSEVAHIGGDGASSVGTNSPDYFQPDDKDSNHRYGIDSQNNLKLNNNIKRESVKRLSMHALSSREICAASLPTYSALSLPRESRRREPLGQDAKAAFELTTRHPDLDQSDIQQVVIKNDLGPLGLHVVPCYDLLGNDQGLRVEGIEPNGRIAKDGQIDLHDKIIRINGHNLLRIPFTKVQEILRSSMSESSLKISVIKHKKPSSEIKASPDKLDQPDDNLKKLQCSNYNLLQSANTRKIGRMIEIELTKGTNGLGFSVTTRDNPAGGHCPIYIKNILPKGAAVEDGRLRPGDRLLEVNKIEMTGKSQAEVVSLLRSIPPGGKVRMTVSRQEEVASPGDPPNIPVSTNNIPTTEPTWTSPSVSPIKAPEDFKNANSYEKNYKQLPDEVVLSPRKNRIILTLDIPVHDSEKAGLGVSVKGKTTSADENTNMDLGIFIKSVIHGGAASRDGRLKTNDQLLNVNGVSLLGLSNSDAMETLRRAMLNTNSVISGVITLTIARRVSAYDSDKNYRNDGLAPCKLESANSIFISDNKEPGPRVMEKTHLNNQEDDNLLSSASVSPWNPVIERLTEQYNKNSIRNESYCLATNKTWIESVSNAKRIMRDDEVLLEESLDEKKTVDDKESQYSGDPSYDSQQSLEEFSSVFQIINRQLTLTQKRFRGKINITKPRKPHYTRCLYEEVLTPFYKPARADLPLSQLCGKIFEKRKKEEKEVHPYHVIIAREVFNWFRSSKMIAFVHKNSISSGEIFEAAVPLYRANMHIKFYGSKIMKLALINTPYESVLPLTVSPWMVIFASEINVDVLMKVLKQTPQLIFMAGIIDGVLLNVNDFVRYGKTDIAGARASLVQTLQTSGGANIHRHLSHHQSTLVSHLNAIGKEEIKT